MLNRVYSAAAFTVNHAGGRGPQLRFAKYFQCPHTSSLAGSSLGEDKLHEQRKRKDTAALKDISEMPGPMTLPVVGSTFSFLMHPDFNISKLHVFWNSMIRQYGPILKARVMGVDNMVCTTNPDDIELVMKTTMHNPKRTFFKVLKQIRYDSPNNYFNKKAGLLPEDGAEWWRLRSLVQGPLLRPKNVAMYLPKVDRATLQFMDRIERIQRKTGQVPENFVQELLKWALECVCLVALNKEMGCLGEGLCPDSTPMKMLRHIDDMFTAISDTEMGPSLWRLYRTESYVRLETAHNAFLEIADKCIQEAAQSLEEAGSRRDSQSLSVLETFLTTEGLSKSDAATMILDMMAAGVDTISHSLSFTLYLLAKNPDCQRKLQDEVDRVVGDSHAVLQAEQIARMVYLANVVKESLRVHPLALGTGRVLTEDTPMSGYRVPKGTLVFGYHMNICRDERYFVRPDEFLPERWGRDRPYGVIHPFASLPFSYGTRMCVGKRIAEQEIYTFLIRAMQRYTVTFESPLEMTVKTRLVLKPDIPLAFKFTRRKPV